MAGFTISWNIEGEQQLSRRLTGLAERIRDMTPAFQETAITLQDLFATQVFETQGAVIDEHWDPLSPTYEARKAKKYPGKGILEATGAMREGFLSLWRPDMAKVWNQVEYFKYHQSNQPRGKIPRRVMMKLAENQREQVVKIFQTFLAMPGT